ncbi:hypothetical protein R1flu_020055 [Riccia fluitans]|uniref:Uncharacterized protein n=1 Tax=Riccia fluitans TaxID=41844 RepID=A0ABD1ZKW0_9MARC
MSKEGQCTLSAESLDGNSKLQGFLCLLGYQLSRCSMSGVAFPAAAVAVAAAACCTRAAVCAALSVGVDLILQELFLEYKAKNRSRGQRNGGLPSFWPGNCSVHVCTPPPYCRGIIEFQNSSIFPSNVVRHERLKALIPSPTEHPPA